jgi:hypothetical protein
MVESALFFIGAGIWISVLQENIDMNFAKSYLFAIHLFLVVMGFACALKGML